MNYWMILSGMVVANSALIYLALRTMSHFSGINKGEDL